MTRAMRVTRDVEVDDPGNYLGRGVLAGETFYTCDRPTYGCIDSWAGVALTENADGDYPFFQFPHDAIEPLPEAGDEQRAEPREERKEHERGEDGDGGGDGLAHEPTLRAVEPA